MLPECSALGTSLPTYAPLDQSKTLALPWSNVITGHVCIVREFLEPEEVAHATMIIVRRVVLSSNATIYPEVDQQ